MRTIVHLADLHFGKTRRERVAALLYAIRAARPDLIAISGDFTQRGREGQYEQAREFIGELTAPVIMTPGNHDVSLWNVYRRFFRPTERFTRILCDNLSPVYRDDELVVAAANSTRPFALDLHGFWKNGTLSSRQLQTLQEDLNGKDARQLRIVVMHHPLVNPWNMGRRDTVRRRRRIITALERMGVDLVLSGHLHKAYVKWAPASPGVDRRILCVQAGTAISTRLRGEGNAFNILRWNEGRLELTVMRLEGDTFEPESTQEHNLRPFC